ncbi:transposase family protein [Nonomuraea sp. NPDC050540]|uniref:transposase family protein n=1 Tax=Nonomuraea sp. NPDC050540 TaxID=3364367 RepID=UPI0037B482C3
MRNVLRCQPYLSGKHRVHGMNIQVIATRGRKILWTSGALPGKSHDLTAARIWGIPRALDHAGIITLADKAYQGAEGPVHSPYKGKNKTASQKRGQPLRRQAPRPRRTRERPEVELEDPPERRCSPSKAGHLCKPSLSCGITELRRQREDEKRSIYFKVQSFPVCGAPTFAGRLHIGV